MADSQSPPAPPMFAIGSPKWPGLSKLSEEAGEVVQVIGKLMGTGGDPMHWDGSDLRQRLVEELGDLQAAITFVIAYCDIDPAAVGLRTAQKLTVFDQWHREQGGSRG